MSLKSDVHNETNDDCVLGRSYFKNIVKSVCAVSLQIFPLKINVSSSSAKSVRAIISHRISSIFLKKTSFFVQILRVTTLSCISTVMREQTLHLVIIGMPSLLWMLKFFAPLIILNSSGSCRIGYWLYLWMSLEFDFHDETHDVVESRIWTLSFRSYTGNQFVR